MIKKEAVNHPAHYGRADDPYEVIKVLDAWGLGFCLGNTVKYIARAGKKIEARSKKLLAKAEHLSRLQDLKKAEWYLRHEINRLEGQNDKR